MEAQRQEYGKVNSTYQPNNHTDTRLARQGGSSVLRTQLGAQLISVLLGPWLGYYFIYVTASLSTNQMIRFMVSLSIGLALMNIAHFLYAYFVSRRARAYLDHLYKNKPLPEGSEKLTAWNEASLFPRRSALAQFLFSLLLIIIPVVWYMQFSASITTPQMIYMAIGCFISALVVIIFGFLFLEGRLTQIREILLPDETAVRKLRFAMSQRTKQYFAIGNIVLVALLTIGGIGYERILALFVPGANATAIFSTFRLNVILIGILLFGLSLFLASRLVLSIANPTREIIRIMDQVRQGDFSEKARILTSDDMAGLTIRFNQLTEQLYTTQTTLGRQVEERTASLEQRSRQLQAAAQVAREATSLQDLNTVLNLTVNLISEQFGFYHAGLFLIDDTGEYAVLQAASSEGGKKMLARGHRLLIGQQGIVGNAAYYKKPRIAMDVGADRAYFNNPDLPLTRSEAGIPLIVRNKVIGVLDIQSTEEAKFTSGDIEVLQILADQVALAIQNARLFTESQDAIQKLEVVTAENVRRAWRSGSRNVKNAYRYTGGGLTTAVKDHTKISFVDDPSNYLQIPILLRGQQLGVISLHRKGNTPWSESDRSLVNEISNQIGLALENARLVQATQFKAEREQTLSQMTARIRETLDVDVVLQTAIREIKQSFNLDRAEVRLKLVEPGKEDNPPRQS